jgi:hypothetical protein
MASAVKVALIAIARSSCGMKFHYRSLPQRYFKFQEDRDPPLLS